MSNPEGRVLQLRAAITYIVTYQSTWVRTTSADDHREQPLFVMTRHRGGSPAAAGSSRQARRSRAK